VATAAAQWFYAGYPILLTVTSILPQAGYLQRQEKMAVQNKIVPLKKPPKGIAVVNDTEKYRLACIYT
jgi:hypothetical protein